MNNNSEILKEAISYAENRFGIDSEMVEKDMDKVFSEVNASSISIVLDGTIKVTLPGLKRWCISLNRLHPTSDASLTANIWAVLKRHVPTGYHLLKIDVHEEQISIVEDHSRNDNG